VAGGKQGGGFFPALLLLHFLHFNLPKAGHVLKVGADSEIVKASPSPLHGNC
jgi:hypothetical protein